MTSGSNVRPPPVIPGHRQVLAMVADLVADLDRLTVDEIDGEFYWRCCRADLAAPITAFHHSISLPVFTDSDDSRSQFAFLAAAFRLTDAVRRLEDQLLEGYPRIILDHLAAGNRVAMRIPEVSVNFDMNKGVSYRMAVYSGSWTGAEVERAFRAGASRIIEPLEPLVEHGRLRAGLPAGTPLSPVVQGSSLISFRLVTTVEQATKSDRGPVRVPFIEVVTHHTIPEPMDLSLAYDRKVRDRDKWHLQLPGATRRQEKEVALRTWALGLLTAGRMEFYDALRELTAVSPSLEVSQPGFSQDRQHLLERVPEAEPFLFIRKRRAKFVTKGTERAQP